jgi:hypothetical protein
VTFCDKDWKIAGTKTSLATHIQQASIIPEPFLKGQRPKLESEEEEEQEDDAGVDVEDNSKDLKVDRDLEEEEVEVNDWNEHGTEEHVWRRSVSKIISSRRVEHRSA